MKIHVSQSTKKLLEPHPYEMEEREGVQVKVDIAN